MKSGEQQSIGMAKPAWRIAVADTIDIARLEAGEEPVVHLQPSASSERPCRSSRRRTSSAAGDLIDIALGESGEFQRHDILRYTRLEVIMVAPSRYPMT